MVTNVINTFPLFTWPVNIFLPKSLHVVIKLLFKVLELIIPFNFPVFIQRVEIVNYLFGTQNKLYQNIVIWSPYGDRIAQEMNIVLIVLDQMKPGRQPIKTD